MTSTAHWSQYFALRALSATMQCFNVEENLRTVGAFGSVYSMLSAKRRGRARMNIKRCFPRLSDDEANELAESSIRNMFQIFAVDSLAMPELLTHITWPDRVRIH